MKVFAITPNTDVCAKVCAFVAFVVYKHYATFSAFLQVNSPTAVLMNNNTSVILQSKLGSLWHLQRLQAFMVQVQCASIYSQIVSRHERKLAFYIHFTRTDKDLQGSQHITDNQ